MDEMNSVAAVSAGAEANVSVPAEPANVFGFAPEDDAPAQESGQVFGFAPEGQEQTGEKQPAEQPEQGDAASATEGERNAFARQRRHYQKQMDDLRNSPAMGIGEKLIRDVMRDQGCSETEAISVINKRFAQAYAKRQNLEDIGDDAAEALYEMSNQYASQNAPAQQDRTPEERADAIVADLMNVRVPDGFDMDAAVADDSFRQLLTEFPAAAAVRIYAAENKAKQAPQQVADMLRARQSVPQPTRPTGSVNAEPNFRSMSTEDFWAAKERYRKSLNI